MGGVMANETLRSIYSAADETIAQLDQLNRASQERMLATRQSLDTRVARLGDSSLPFADANWEGTLGPGGPLGTSAPPPRPESAPYVPLPQRTTHGGPFGPKVRAKLLAAALEKDNRW
jgi:hypothetical protein